MSSHTLSFAIRRTICLLKCVRNYRQFQKHALAPTSGAAVPFTVRGNIAVEHGCARRLTWQPAKNNPALEESRHVIMHTHVAWVKIKPYSSLAPLLSSLLPQSISRYGSCSARKAGRGATDFTAFSPKKENKDTTSVFPQIVSSAPIPRVFWNFVHVLTDAPFHPPQLRT